MGAVSCSGSSGNQVTDDPQPPATTYQAATGEQVAGVWADETGAEFTFDVVDGDLDLVSIVDLDGEEFVVRAEGWEGTEYVFTYWVPSTEYVVTFRLHEFAPDVIHSTWSNLSPTGESVTGEETLVRVE
jgi:hypothetical protein